MKPQILILLLLAACSESQQQKDAAVTVEKDYPKMVAEQTVAPTSVIEHLPPSPPIVQAAREQIGKTVRYDPEYTALDYPMGDVPLEKGVCTDVVIRALRQQNVDLQVLIHQDMRKNFSVYPKRWGLKQPDRNIDHRRVLNLMTYFHRHDWAVRDGKYLAGDLVTWELNGSHLPHIGIVSDRKNGNTPLIIHNIGAGTREEDILYRHTITGHFRQPEMNK